MNQEKLNRVRAFLGLDTDRGAKPKTKTYQQQPCQIVYKHNGKAFTQKVYRTHAHAKSALKIAIRGSVDRTSPSVNTDVENEIINLVSQEFEIKDVG